MRKIALITGGARSGKSHFAQELALKMAGPVLFVATATAGDEEMRQRIEEHRRARPSTWQTLEATTHIGGQITQKAGKPSSVIIDCITLLINNIFMQQDIPTGGQIDAAMAEKEALAEIDELIDCFGRVDADFIIVTNEVGLGIVPTDSLTRLYRDLLGKANQLLAKQADEVYLMVAGMPLKIKPFRTP